MSTASVAIACVSVSCGFVFLFVTGVAFFDPPTYTEFFDEMQEMVGIKPPVIRVKDQLWLHRILLLLILMLFIAACVFSVGLTFLQ